MQNKKCVVCGKPGEKHHIIFKSEGGLDFPLNYIYLCSEHHRGKKSPHRNKKINLMYKLEFQNKLNNILTKKYYFMNEIMKILFLNSSQVKSICKKFKLYKEGYKREDIIKRLMGGKVYYDFMLDEFYDDSWNIVDDFISDSELELKLYNNCDF
ncbi:HNH endonuclease signature motif containing protein [Clostridium arbusti]|uniref:HNH endonuclease signature motif containing protein n=1 Tax=Clostridium arbusti TaxID=1137848 RepID=UPI000288BF82|nr:HNH endonuclease signature motif containing protein [Clostridium arbusti]